MKRRSKPKLIKYRPITLGDVVRAGFEAGATVTVSLVPVQMANFKFKKRKKKKK